jgi:crotonobetainyl-CoA:carnitine CoA-transferase CaiB-like acyl-CoA transferase
MKTPLAGRTEHAAPPRIGEHTDAILKEAGLSDAEIAGLRAGGAI